MDGPRFTGTIKVKNGSVAKAINYPLRNGVLRPELTYRREWVSSFEESIA